MFALSERADLKDAICDLRTREGTISRRIGFVDLATGNHRSNVSHIVAAKINAWALVNDFDAVVWTDLASNFKEKTGKPFNLENAMDHLRTLDAEGQEEAREYISKAPNDVDTPLRRYVMADEWFEVKT
jgi:hypothetical protein